MCTLKLKVKLTKKTYKKKQMHVSSIAIFLQTIIILKGILCKIVFHVYFNYLYLKEEHVLRKAPLNDISKLCSI